MRWGMRPSRDTDEVTSTPWSKLAIQQSAVPIEKSSSCSQATKTTAHDIDEADRKKDW